MLIEKELSQDRVNELFDEQRAVFADTIAEGKSYRPLADYFIAGRKVASLRFPSFADYDDMVYKFHMSTWLCKTLRTDESIVYMDTTAEVQDTNTSESISSDVFLAFKTSKEEIIHAAAPYYMNPESKYPVWNQDLEMTQENVFAMSDLIDPLHFAITRTSHLMSLMIVIEFLNQNGFEIEFHSPFAPEALEYLNGKGNY